MSVKEYRVTKVLFGLDGIQKWDLKLVLWVFQM